jgi:hypothetical protein
MYECPVCGFPGLEEPPEDFVICPSCGTEFGYHDHTRTHAQLRHQWVRAGAQWHSQVDERPTGWNPWIQLIDSGHAECVPKWAGQLTFRADIASLQEDEPLMATGRAPLIITRAA